MTKAKLAKNETTRQRQSVPTELRETIAVGSEQQTLVPPEDNARGKVNKVQIHHNLKAPMAETEMQQIVLPVRPTSDDDSKTITLQIRKGGDAEPPKLEEQHTARDQASKTPARGGDSDSSEILDQVIDFGGEEEDQLDDEENKYMELLMQRDAKEVEMPCLMWSVNNNRRMHWDLLVIFLALYNCVMIPLNVAFNTELDEVLPNSLDYFEKAIDILFVLDILLNFRTTFINPKTNIEIVEPTRVAKNYLNSIRFPVDLLASIPFDYFITVKEVDGSQDTLTVQLLGILKLIRLLRLGRIVSYMKVNASLKIGFRIFQLVIALLMLVHWLCCIWYMLVNNDDKNWIPTKDLDAYQTNFFTLSMWEKYSIVFYNSILLVLGNEISPITFGQTLYSASVIILGAFVTSFIFGNMAALMAIINKKDSFFQEQLEMVSQTMRSLKLPQDMQDNVLKYMQYIHETPDVQQDLDKFLELLSPALKNVILKFLHSSVIKKIELLDQCSSVELGFIVNHLKTLLFLPGDVIIRQGEDSFCFYFVNRGIINIQMLKSQIDRKYLKTHVEQQKQKYTAEYNEDQAKQKAAAENENEDADLAEEGIVSQAIHIGLVRDGNYFGEIGLITNLKRTSTAISNEYCTLSSMSNDDLIQSREEYPIIFQKFRDSISKYFDEDRPNKDFDFIFRKKMVKNIPYFRNLDNHILQEIVYLLRPKRYEAGTLIVQRGDEVDQVYLLKTGCIIVEVPVKNPSGDESEQNKESIYLDWLNEGSCFCTYTGFNKDMYQLVNFKASTTCVIESIQISDLRSLARSHITLSDILKTMEIEILNGEKSDLDFFRYKPPRTVEIQDKFKSKMREKFRRGILSFCKEIQSGAREQLEALEALKNFQEDRKIQMKRLNELKFDTNIREKKKLMSNFSTEKNANGQLKKTGANAKRQANEIKLNIQQVETRAEDAIQKKITEMTRMAGQQLELLTQMDKMLRKGKQEATAEEQVANDEKAGPPEGEKDEEEAQRAKVVEETKNLFKHDGGASHGSEDHDLGDLAEVEIVNAGTGQPDEREEVTATQEPETAASPQQKPAHVAQIGMPAPQKEVQSHQSSPRGEELE